MEYKEGDIVRVVLYKQPAINYNDMLEGKLIPAYTEKDLEVILNALIVKRVGEKEYIVAYVVNGEIIKEAIIL